MDIEQVREFCLEFSGATEEFPFDEVTLVFKVEGKMFLLLPLDADQPSVMVKCDPDLAVELREKYADVVPGFHMNKKYWNTLYVDRLDKELVKSWILHSYCEVIKKLPKYKQAPYSDYLR